MFSRLGRLVLDPDIPDEQLSRRIFEEVASRELFAAAGSFLHTLVLVDVATGWTECVALLRRSEADVIGALNSLRGRLPVPLLGLDTDNGSEFINYEMLRYCQREQITFTRSRVNRKNDPGLRRREERVCREAADRVRSVRGIGGLAAADSAL